MASFLWFLGWFLIGIAAIVISYPLFGDAVAFEPLKNTLPAGVLIALAAQIFSQSKSITEAREKRSHFYLDSCVQAFEEARSLLEDGNNDRGKWIAAGRALGHAQELAKGVTEDAHKRVLELHRLKYRGVFGSLLADRTAAFFYGVDPTLSVDEAAKQSSRGEERNGRSLVSGVRELSGKALRAVWQAAQWPENYQDPLDVEFTPKEQESLRLLYPGLHDFLEHRSQWLSVAGKLHERPHVDARQ